MSKTCPSCGREYKQKYCEHCGYGDPNLKTHAADKYKTQKAVRYMTPEEKEEYYADLKRREEERRRTGKQQRDPKQVRLLIVLAVAAAVMIGWALIGSGVFSAGNSSSEVVANFFKAVNERDFDRYANCHSAEQKAAILADLRETGLTESEYMDEFCSVFAEEYGTDFAVTYTIEKTEPLTDYSMDDYRAAYGTVPNISEAELVIIDVTFKGSQGEETFKMHAYTAHIGLSWRIIGLAYAPGTITTDME